MRSQDRALHYSASRGENRLNYGGYSNGSDSPHIRWTRPVQLYSPGGAIFTRLIIWLLWITSRKSVHHKRHLDRFSRFCTKNTDRQTDRQSDRQTDRQTDRQAHGQRWSNTLHLYTETIKVAESLTTTVRCIPWILSKSMRVWSHYSFLYWLPRNLVLHLRSTIWEAWHPAELHNVGGNGSHTPPDPETDRGSVGWRTSRRPSNPEDPHWKRSNNQLCSRTEESGETSSLTGDRPTRSAVQGTLC